MGVACGRYAEQVSLTSPGGEAQGSILECAGGTASRAEPEVYEEDRGDHREERKRMKTRREFLRDSGMMVAGGMALAGTLQYAEALPNGKPIGFQTFEIFKNLTDDWQGTWNAMAAMGYKFADLDYFGP